MTNFEKLNKKFDELQEKYGAKDLQSVYGYGCKENPKVALVFMNPTKRNIATDKNWKGIRAQWLGTKQIWEFLTKCGLFDDELYVKIKNKKPSEWTPEFCQEVYDNVMKHGVWITNLAKCTQEDARPLSDNVFKDYRDLFIEEMNLVNPKQIFFFGNQVSSVMLEENISVSTSRGKLYTLNSKGQNFDCYAIYYPVGNGRFNQDKAVEDVRKILQIN